MLYQTHAYRCTTERAPTHKIPPERGSRLGVAADKREVECHAKVRSLLFKIFICCEKRRSGARRTGTGLPVRE
jgi:hypothetical protein